MRASIEAMLLASLAVPTLRAAQQPAAALGRVYEYSEVSRKPIPVSSPGLKLPDGFNRADIRDTLVVAFVVDTAGRVDPKSIAVVHSGNPVLQAAFIEVIRQTVYSPAWVGDKRASVRLQRTLPPPVPPGPSLPARASVASIRARVRALVGSGPFSAPAIDRRVPTRESCEGYDCGCQYGTWQAMGTIAVFPGELDTSRVAFTLDSGARFDTQRGFLHILRPAVLIVLDTVDEGEDHRFVRGDTLYLLDYVGELFSNVQHGDSVFQMEQFWAPEEHLHPKGALVRSGVYEWWVPIQAAGRAGWIRPRERKTLRGPSPFCFPTADSTIW